MACPATPNHLKNQEYILHGSLGRPHLPGRLYIGLLQNYDTPQSNASPPGYTKMQKTHGFWKITTNSIRWWVFTSMLVSWCSRKYSNDTFRAFFPFTHSEGHSFMELTWAHQHPWISMAPRVYCRYLYLGDLVLTAEGHVCHVACWVLKALKNRSL